MCTCRHAYMIWVPVGWNPDIPRYKNYKLFWVLEYKDSSPNKKGKPMSYYRRNSEPGAYGIELSLDFAVAGDPSCSLYAQAGVMIIVDSLASHPMHGLTCPLYSHNAHQAEASRPHQWSPEWFKVGHVMLTQELGMDLGAQGTIPLLNSENSIRFYISFSCFCPIFIELYIVGPLGFFMLLFYRVSPHWILHVIFL